MKHARGGRITLRDEAKLDLLVGKASLSEISRKMRRDPKTVRKMLQARKKRSRPQAKKAAPRPLKQETRRELAAIEKLLKVKSAAGPELAHGTYQKLRAALKAQGIVLSRNQVRYRCKLLGVVGRVRPKCPTTDPAKLKRIRAFARKWRPWAADPANVRKLIVCDEWPGATHDASDRTQLTLPGSKPVPRRRRKRYADHSVQAWVCFGWNFRKIVFSDSRTSRHNSRTYREDCLKPVLRELKLGWFYQDGARCHWGNTSKKTDPEGPMELSNRQFLEQERVNVIEPPVDAPNLNPAENVFSIANGLVSERRHEISSIDDLKKVMGEVFRKLPIKLLRSTLSNFHCRLQQAAANPLAAGSNRQGGPKKKRVQL